jgi:hypothetical protein
MAKLDTNAAWKEASGLVAANRDVFLALAGVFFMLPSLALTVILGEPQVEPGMQPDQLMAVMREFYGRAWWLILLGSLLQVVGILAILTLMRDRSRPTVGDAIKSGLAGTPSYLAAQLMLGFAIVAAALLLVGGAAALSPVLAVAAVLLLICAMVFVMFRMILVAPLVAVDGMRNPLAALRGSWALTKGNFWRIFGFIALVVVLFLIVLAIVMLVVGIVLAVATSGETQRVVAAVFSSALTAIAVVYFCGMIAAIHRQLGGPATRELSETFE